MLSNLNKSLTGLGWLCIANYSRQKNRNYEERELLLQATIIIPSSPDPEPEPDLDPGSAAKYHKQATMMELQLCAHDLTNNRSD